MYNRIKQPSKIGFYYACLLTVAFIFTCIHTTHKINEVQKKYDEQTHTLDIFVADNIEIQKTLSKELTHNKILLDIITSLNNDTFNTSNISNYIKVIAKTYNIDSYLVEAIIIHETGNYTSDKYNTLNNVCGMRYRNSYDFVSYPNKEQSVIACVRNLRFNYIDEGLVTIEQIANKYAPTDDTTDTSGSNSN